MCLNRYYFTEGVKVYAQETWKDIFEDTGRSLVL